MSAWHFQTDDRGTTVQTLNCLGTAWHLYSPATELQGKPRHTNCWGDNPVASGQPRISNHRCPVAVGNFPALFVAADEPTEITSQDSGGPPKASFALEVHTSHNSHNASMGVPSSWGPAFKTRRQKAIINHQASSILKFPENQVQ